MSKRIATPEMKQALGRLITAGRLELGKQRPEFSRMVELSLSGLKNIENGVAWPQDATTRNLEKALRWKAGVIDELLDREDLGTVALEDVTDVWAVAGIQPARKASELSTDELLAELTHRVKGMEAELSRMRSSGDDQASVRARQQWFDMAAYDLPGEKERGRGKPSTGG
jgi:hypothetical protein